MDAVPRDLEELMSAFRRQNQAQLGAWTDQFSTPQEQYAALRALAETLGRQPAGLGRDLGRWAEDRMLQAFCPDEALIEVY